MIIGIGGKGGSGKSLAASYLVENHGFREITFAAPLKAAAELLFDFNPEQLYGSGKDLVDWRVKLSPREVMQRLGDFCRDLWPEVFVEAVRRQIVSPNNRYVISDVRFINEAEMLAAAGAYMVRIERDAAGLAGAPGCHVSENNLDCWPGWDAKIKDCSKKELFSRLDELVQAALILAGR